MRGDYKYEMQMLAEERAFEATGREYYDLPQEEQYQFFQEGMEDWIERKWAEADRLRESDGRSSVGD